MGISSKAQNQNTRYDLESLYGVTFDVSTLSMSDYLVCCFSSQVRVCVCVGGGVGESEIERFGLVVKEI